MHNITQRALLIIGLSLICAQTAYSAATRVAFIDPFAIARGNAFTATADNPSAVFYNAAGLTQLEGTRLQAGFYAISLDWKYDGYFPASMDDDFQPIPNIFVSHQFSETDFSIGFGVYAPLALGTDWGNLSLIAQTGLPYKAELKYVKYHLVGAWKVSDTFSVAAGTSFDDGELELNSIPGGALGSFKGSDNTIGYSASALWQPNQHHSVGINYQTGANMDFSGASTLLGAAEAGIEFPKSIVIGYSWRPNDKWNIELDIDWTDWDVSENLTLNSTLAPVSVAVPFDWQSSLIWEFGVTRYFENGIHLSAGYSYVENAIPDATLLPILPDKDRPFFSIGVGREQGHFTWQLSVQAAIADRRKVIGNVFGLDGEYDTDSKAVAFSIGLRF